MPLSRLLPVPPLNSTTTFRRFAVPGVTTQFIYYYTLFTPAPANLADKNAGIFSPYLFNKGRTMDGSSIVQFCFSGIAV
jgi:hypothetical protein